MKAIYPAIVRMLKELIKKETVADVVSKANGLLTLIKSFDSDSARVEYGRVLLRFILE